MRGMRTGSLGHNGSGKMEKDEQEERKEPDGERIAQGSGTHEEEREARKR